MTNKLSQISKSAQGNSMNVIVVAVIAVLVLLVMTFIFLRGVGGPQGDLNNCINRGGKCETTCGENTFQISAKCAEGTGGSVCCISNDQLVNRFTNPSSSQP
jgi:hypothetical protein